MHKNAGMCMNGFDDEISPVEEKGPADGDVSLDGEGHCRKAGAGESYLWEYNGCMNIFPTRERKLKKGS